MNNTSVKNKKTKKNLTTILLLIFLVLLSGLFLYYKNSTRPVSANNQDKIEIEIPAGTSTSQIGEILIKNNLIKDKLVFAIKAKLSSNPASLKAGIYEFSKSMSLEDIINRLKEGGKSGNIVKFTIPEGFEIYLIAEKLENEKLANKDKFIDLTSDKRKFEDDFEFLKELGEGQSLEGFLFPSTYEIFKDASEEDIIRKMLKEFELVYEEIIKEDAKKLELSLNEVVTMASLVEREARTDEERPLIAGVYYNRLAINMKLRCDATVLYALGERKDRVLFKDLEIDSPYNTYKYYGLPIGPISSVGKASIKAALFPEDSDYLYYVAKPDRSGHVFTKTLAEHNKYRDEYLKSLD